MLLVLITRAVHQVTTACALLVTYCFHIVYCAAQIRQERVIMF